jgi:hypothetical protein
MSLHLAHLIWDSVNGISTCSPLVPVKCGDSARAMSVYPKYFGNTDDIDWVIANANADEWTSETGARNGVAVTSNGIVYLYDIQADATSDELENSPYAKLSLFLSYCCEDCGTTPVTIDGEYNGTYDSLPASTFCYTVTITDAGYVGSDEAPSDYPTAYDLTQIAMTVPDDYLVSDVTFVSYNTSTDDLVVRMCLSAEVTTTGAPLGFPSNWAFAAI